MTTPREETKADEDKPRFVGPFVRLTRPLHDGTEGDYWVRFSDVLGIWAVVRPALDGYAPKRSQTMVIVFGQQEFVLEPPALVLGLLAEALEKAGREEHRRVEQQIAVLAKSVASADRAGCLDGPELDTPLAARLESKVGRVFLRAQLRRVLAQVGLYGHGWLNKMEDGSLLQEEIEHAVIEACERHKTLVSELDQQLRALDAARDEVAVLRQRLATYEPAADSEAVQP